MPGGGARVAILVDIHGLWVEYLILYGFYVSKMDQNVIRMEDMLSIPYYPLFSLAISSISNSSKMLPESVLFFILDETHSIIYSFFLTYQIPSHPIMMKSMFSFFIIYMSGSAVIICSSAGNFLLFLYSKSPSARDKFRFPFTLPNDTYPPALCIRSIYFLSSGL